MTQATQGRRRVVLELDGAIDAIAGTVRAEGVGDAVPFVGWLQLADALERTAAEPTPTSDDGECA